MTLAGGTVSTDRRVLTFATEGTWSLNDLRVLVESFSALYQLRLYERYLIPLSVQHGPHLKKEHVARWEELRLWLDSKVRMFPRNGYLRIPRTFQLDVQLAQLWNLVSRVDSLFGPFDPEVTKRALRPYVANITINSPGNISIVGLGDILRELREFIKDFHYRNRDEKRLSGLKVRREELEYIKDRLALEQDLALSPNEEAPPFRTTRSRKTVGCSGECSRTVPWWANRSGERLLIMPGGIRDDVEEIKSQVVRHELIRGKGGL